MRVFDTYCKEHGWTIVHRFIIPHVGWDMDNDAAIARDVDGDMHVLTTNHGGLRVDVDIEEYRDRAVVWLKGLEMAVKLLVTDEEK